MLLTNTHLVARTNNRKTGPLPVTYRRMSTCPSDCPFLPTGPIGGCYGTGRLFSSAERRSTDLDVEAATWRVRLDMEPGVRYLRDRVVGDVLNARGALDRTYIRGISRVARFNGLVPFGYTHAWRRFTPADVEFLRRQGYAMSASTETHEGVVEALATGLPVVLVDDDAPEGARVGGRRLVTCPAQTRGDVTCASCGLCARPDREVIVRFRTHGVARARARATVASARRGEGVRADKTA